MSHQGAGGFSDIATRGFAAVLMVFQTVAAASGLQKGPLGESLRRGSYWTASAVWARRFSLVFRKSRGFNQQVVSRLFF